MNRVFGFLLMLFSIEGASQSSTNMDSLKFRANYRINTFLDHDHSLGGYYRIDDNGVTIYSSPRSITGNSVRDTSASMSRPEYFLGWNEVEIFEKLLKMYPKDSVIRILQAK
ncbi:MAG TPA: hypothetical protein VL651_05120, partial [Bacteroidia bacterium]|nr:hypothetical protein [Bacteroidia bacterium]